MGEKDSPLLPGPSQLPQPSSYPAVQAGPVRLIQSQPVGRRDDAGGVCPCPRSQDSLRGPCGGQTFRAGGLPFAPSLPGFSSSLWLLVGQRVVVSPSLPGPP